MALRNKPARLPVYDSEKNGKGNVVISLKEH
jgi:hypothetical protein